MSLLVTGGKFVISGKRWQPEPWLCLRLWALGLLEQPGRVSDRTGAPMGNTVASVCGESTDRGVLGAGV